MKFIPSIKRFIPLISFALLGANGNAQLIINGGFETNSSYPVNLGEWQVVQGWNNANSLISSPDYYHYSSGSAADIPETPMAIVNASEGNAIMGLIVSGKNHTNTREYISTQLAAPLVVGKQYLVKFKICNGEKTETSYSGLGASDIGLLFATTEPSQIDQTPIVQTPQFKFETVFYDREWTSVNFVLTAEQAYTFMTFGIFDFDDEIEIEVREGVDPLFAYYFVDEFSLEILPEDYDPTNGDDDNPAEREPISKPDLSSTIDSPEPFFVPNSFSPNGDLTNETFKPVANTLTEWEFSIFNVWGEQLFFTNDETKGWDGNYNTQQCPNGNYVWKISYNSWDETAGSKRIDEQGIVVLLR